MKKKIINGILIVAALFATSTSFVSCKDNLADEVDQGFAKVQQDMNALQSKISDVEGKIATLESSVLKNSEEIANLKTQLASLQNDLKALEAKVDKNTEDIAALDKRLTALEEEVNSLMGLINNLAVGVTVRQTIDPVIGSINLPGYNPLFLAAYVGENFSGITQFPHGVKPLGNGKNPGDEYNVDQLYGNVILESEVAVDPIWISEGEGTGDGERGLIMGYKHNAGTLYFTLNPIGLDASQLSFDLVNSLGTVSPVTIDNVQQSSYINSPSIGKHGNGSETGEDTENPYLYSAEATIPLEANADLAWNKEINQKWVIGTGEGDLNHELSTLIAQIKAGIPTTSILTSSVDLLQNIYQKLYTDLTAKQYQNLRVTYSDGNGTERIITSPENIVTATVTPLSYNDLYMLGGLVGGLQIDHEILESLIAKLVGAVRSQLPEIKDITIEEMHPGSGGGYIFAVEDADKEYYYHWVNGSGRWYEDEDGQTEVTGEINGGLVEISKLLDTIIDQMNGKIATANDMIKKVLDEYNVVRTGSSVNSKLAERAASILANTANGFITSLGSNPAFNAVTPIVLFDSKNGIQRLFDGITVSFGTDKAADIEDDDFPLVLTSATNEYLVPAYKKYVAVLQGGKPVFAQLLDGSEKILNVKLPMGQSEIIYSTVDYKGYTVTKRYNVTRKAYGK